MANHNNATCAICGKGYKMCLSCDKGDVSKHWKIHCDTPEHYKIFQVIHGYTCGVYTKAEAAEKLSHIDLSDFDELRDNIKQTLNEIRSVDAIAKPKAKPVSKPYAKKVASEAVEDVAAVANKTVKSSMGADKLMMPTVNKVVSAIE